jgi:hypothetical protein
MLPTTHAIACPHCAALTLHQPRFACIQFRQRFWSDGYALPEEAPPCTLLRCQACTQFFGKNRPQKWAAFAPIQKPAAANSTPPGWPRPGWPR